MAVDTDVRATPPPQGGKEEILKGIGGWLVLVAIGQVIAVLRCIVSLLGYYTDPATQQAFEKITNAAVGEALLNTAYAGLILFSTYAFFAQKRYFRNLYLAEVLSAPLLYVLDALWI